MSLLVIVNVKYEKKLLQRIRLSHYLLLFSYHLQNLISFQFFENIKLPVCHLTDLICRVFDVSVLLFRKYFSQVFFFQIKLCQLRSYRDLVLKIRERIKSNVFFKPFLKNFFQVVANIFWNFTCVIYREILIHFYTKPKILL